jgi:hypothetical protein
MLCSCCFGSQGVQIQGFVLVRQVLYCLSLSSSPFCCGILEIGSHFLPRSAWTPILLFYASCHCWDDKRAITPSFFSVEIGSWELFAWLAWNPSFPDLGLPCSTCLFTWINSTRKIYVGKTQVQQSHKFCNIL